MKTLTKALLAALCVSFLALPAVGQAAPAKKPQTIEAQQVQKKKATKKVAVKKKNTQQAAKKQTKVAKATKKTNKYQNQ
ncbi:hypothetical protein [Nitratidesulfovibrio sp. SRB-5]|uniref:hypothetical protein n=1 Tax=Nitratidesulfovibrio sp. SRB-5 TaxID=2872636 RepID=UPI001024A91F|nr:hypothetical protein [Nitratidesulfovibrio sp. SRB-5]MBZ2171580.1 hypothetical protein [Nitratidesulfovibrio sp. SRB-5]RXF76191.1 hypothetical protein EKK70_13185 [Desulfovibrio sp. DS-1]